jgi:NADH-quinone oxidoreductase subunit H
VMFHLIPPSILTYGTPVVCAVVIVLVLPVLAACILIVECKIVADAQARRAFLNGAMSTGSHSLLQPVADAVQLMLRKDVTPPGSSRLFFWGAPLISLLVALLAFSVVPIGPAFQIADLNIGLLFILGIGSLGAYVVMLGSWGSNTPYSQRETLRSAAQLISYQSAAALAVISALLLSGSLSMREIVQSQLDQGQWFIFYVPVAFVIYFIGSLVGTNHGLCEPLHADTKSVTGHGTGYTGFRWFVHFLAEYANMIIFAGIATTAFLGGWLRPLASYRDRFPGSSIELLDVLPAVAVAGIALYCCRRALNQPVKIRRTGTWCVCGICAVAAAMLVGSMFASGSFMQGVHGAFWFVVKAGAYMYCLLRVRSTFPRLRSDLSNQLAWRILVPISFVNLITAGAAIVTSQNTGLPMRFTTILATSATVAVAWWLFKDSAHQPAILAANGE